MRITIQRICSIIFTALVLAAVPGASVTMAADQAPVTFQFVDVDIPVVIQFISEVTGKNFIFDERVRGKVTILAPEPIDADQAFTLFTSILDLKGYTVVPAGPGGYKVVPSGEAKQSGTRILTGEGGGVVNEGYVARIFSLRYVSAKDAFIFLQPLVSKDGHIASFAAGNLLLVVDASLNLEKIQNLIHLVDVPSSAPPVERILLEHADAQEVATIVEKALTGGPVGRVRGGKVAGGSAPEEEVIHVLSDTRLNAVILVGENEETVAAAKHLIELLDQPVEQARAGIHVIDLQYANATDLAEVLNKLFSSQKTSVQRPQPVRGAAAQPTAAVTPEFEGPVRITPDVATNSLVVMASPADIRGIQEVVRRLDRRRRQVLVEALFTEVRVNDLEDLGTKWRILADNDNEPVAVGGFGTIDSSTFSSILQGLSGASIGGLGNFFDFSFTDTEGNTVSLSTPGYAFLFSLQEFKQAVDVLSAPHILTSDNQEAEIMVGENVPFISKRETSPTGTTSDAFFNVIERTDVGIKLRIKPQITEGDTLKLDIYQEISALEGDQSEQILTQIGPTTTKRSTETSITVRDGSTVVIGGLMQEQGEVTVQKVPLLGDIPLLGWLFRSQSDTRRKTNLLIFLTPHVVRNDDSLQDLSRNKERIFRRETGKFIENQAVVSFVPGVSQERVDEILGLVGATPVVLREDGLVIALPPGGDLAATLRELGDFPEVQGAAPNFFPFGTQLPGSLSSGREPATHR